MPTFLTPTLRGAVVGAVVGLLAGWGLWRPRAVPVDVAAPSIHQKDASLVLARKPDTVLRVTNIVPKGWVRERDAALAIQARARIDTQFVPGPERKVLKVDTLPATPVHVALTVARLPDGTHRIIASSPDGTVLDSASVDVPREAALPPPKVLRWSAGVTRDLATAAWGAVVSRDTGPFRVFAVGQPAQAGLKAQLQVGVGIRF